MCGRRRDRVALRTQDAGTGRRVTDIPVLGASWPRLNAARPARLGQALGRPEPDAALRVAGGPPPSGQVKRPSHAARLDGGRCPGRLPRRNGRRIREAVPARRVIKAPAWHHAGAFMRTGRSSALRAAASALHPPCARWRKVQGRSAVRDQPLRTNRLVKLISHITAGDRKRDAQLVSGLILLNDRCRNTTALAHLLAAVASPLPNCRTLLATRASPGLTASTCHAADTPGVLDVTAEDVVQFLSVRRADIDLVGRAVNGEGNRLVPFGLAIVR